MINYYISYNNPHRHFVDFELSARTLGKEKMQFQLAAWRPGRYELGNFAQNIQKWEGNFWLFSVYSELIHGHHFISFQSYQFFRDKS